MIRSVVTLDDVRDSYALSLAAVELNREREESTLVVCYDKYYSSTREHQEWVGKIQDLVNKSRVYVGFGHVTPVLGSKIAKDDLRWRSVLNMDHLIMIQTEQFLKSEKRTYNRMVKQWIPKKSWLETRTCQQTQPTSQLLTQTAQSL